MDEDLSFEDRFAEVPDVTADPETEAKKLELLKLAQQGLVPPPDLATLPMKTPLQRMMPAPSELPGAPKAQGTAPILPPAPPVEPDYDKLRAAGIEGLKAGFDYAKENKLPLQTETPPVPEPEPTDISKLSTAQPRAAEGFQPAEPTPTREVDVRQAGGDIKKFRGFTPEVETAIVSAAKKYGVDPDMLRAFVAIESNGDPNSNRNKKTQYKGLMQIGRDEWSKFGQGDIYNANDNIDAGARLLRDNAARFERVMGRPPTPREQYLMHQQGLGFYTKGTMTNIAGNLPASAKGDPANWTREGFERFWGNKLDHLIQQAKGSQVTGSVPMTELASFMGGQPTATQRTDLTGGLADTPIRAAQTAALMGGTPIEKIKAISEIMNKAATSGAIKNVSGQIPRTVRPQRGQAPVEGQLPQEGSVTHTRPDMLPIPGLDPNQYPMLTEALNPSVMSTINAYRNNGQVLPQLPTAPEVKAPSQIEAQKPSFVQNAMKIASYLAPLASAPVNPAAVGQLAAQGITDYVRGTLPEVPSGKDVADFARGTASGVAQQPTDMATGFVVTPLSALGLLSGSDQLKDIAVSGIQGAEDWKAGVREQLGIDTVRPSDAATAGETLGRNLNPVNAAKTIMNLAGSFAGELIQPTISKIAQKYPVQSIFGTPAHAATVFGEIPRVVQTPGGPVVMNDASLSEFVYGGIAALGFGFAPGIAAKTANYLKHNPTVMFIPNPITKWTDPRRPVVGAPGTVAASLPRDMLKGGSVDTSKSMMDIADRQARYTKGTKVGIDPIVATEVEQRLKVQTGSGLLSQLNNATTMGKMQTEAHVFDAPPLGKISEFAKANPDFNHYLKARMMHEQLFANERFNVQNTMKAGATGNPPAQPKPRFYDDAAGNRWTLNDAANQARWYEQQNPEFRRVYQDYRANIVETQRFVTEGPNHTQNKAALTTEAIKRPSYPIFDKHEDVDGLLKRVINDDAPLAILEDRMKGALGTMLKQDAHLQYIAQAGTQESFTPRSARWVKEQGKVADAHDAIIDFTVDGKKIYYTTDPLLAGMMRTGVAPAPSAIAKALSIGKRPFTITATGWAAPQFVITSLMRALEQGATTAPVGLRRASGIPVLPAGPFSHPAGVIARLYPQAARALVPPAKWFEGHINNGPLRGMGGTNLISRTLEKAYMDSFYRRMEVVGAFGANPHWDADKVLGRVTQLKQQYANTNVSPMINYLHDAASNWRRFLKGAGLTAFHAYDQTRVALSDPAFGYAWKAGRKGNPTLKGRTISDAELGQMYRQYTGDPGTKGSVYTETREGKGATLRYEGPGAWRAEAYKNVGRGVADMRHFVPWMDILIQSPAQTLRALRENPVRAGLAFTATGVLPEMVAFLWNMQQGQEYLDYQFNHRGSYNIDNYIYVARPGRPPQEGIEVPINQESIFPRAGTRSFMRQWAGLSSHNVYDEVNTALLGFLGQTFIPPAPPGIAGIYTGLSGKLVPQGTGFITGQSFTGRQNQLDQTGNSNFEKALRQWGAGLADIGIHFYDAYTSSPKGDVWGAVDKGTRAAGYRMASKTPLVRDWLGYRPPVTGSPEVNDELFRKRRFIDDVIQVVNTWDKRKGGISTKGFGLKPEGQAKAGKFIADKPPAVGDMIPNPGVSRDMTKNPLFNETIKEIKKTFDEDGNIGYKSMWKNYSTYSQMVRRMYAVNTGNEKQWIDEYQKANPKLAPWLEKHGVNPNDFRQVRDFYNLQRQTTGQMILYSIKATEQRLNKNPKVRAMLGGKEFEVEMLHPDKEGIEPGSE